ncbi:hypothetical protein FA15DRAFT_711476, partial [Coprinopsis marcescibilis]
MKKLNHQVLAKEDQVRVLLAELEETRKKVQEAEKQATSARDRAKAISQRMQEAERQAALAREEVMTTKKKAQEAVTRVVKEKEMEVREIRGRLENTEKEKSAAEDMVALKIKELEHFAARKLQNEKSAEAVEALQD